MKSVVRDRQTQLRRGRAHSVSSWRNLVNLKGDVSEIHRKLNTRMVEVLRFNGATPTQFEWISSDKVKIQQSKCWRTLLVWVEVFPKPGWVKTLDTLCASVVSKSLEDACVGLTRGFSSDAACLGYSVEVHVHEASGDQMSRMWFIPCQTLSFSCRAWWQKGYCSFHLSLPSSPLIEQHITLSVSCEGVCLQHRHHEKWIFPQIIFVYQCTSHHYYYYCSYLQCGSKSKNGQTYISSSTCQETQTVIDGKQNVVNV